jgi:hypothetical protein
VAEALGSKQLSDERRRVLIQRLVRLTLPNATVLYTVMARLMLVTRARPAPIPALIKNLPVRVEAQTARGSESGVA